MTLRTSSTSSRRTASRDSNARNAGGRQASPSAAGSAENSPILPTARTNQTYGYGNTKRRVLPNQLDIDSSANVSDMADNIDTGLREADERVMDEDTGPYNNDLRSTRRARRASSTRPGSATRPIYRREVTPDDQLLESLREASEEPDDRQNSIAGNSTVESSSISWIIERNVSGDLRQRSEEPDGANLPNPKPARGETLLSRPPSRGLRLHQFSPLHAPIPEEPHRHPLDSVPPFPPPVVLSSAPAKQVAPSTVPSNPVDLSDITPTSDSAPTPSKDDSMSAADSQVKAPALPERPSGTEKTAETLKASRTTKTAKAAKIKKRPKEFTFSLHTLLTAFLSLLAAFNIYVFRDDLKLLPEALRSYTGRASSPISIENATAYTEAFNKLSSGVDRRLSNMAKDFAALKDEWDRRLPHLQQFIRPPPTNPLFPPKVNFLSPGMGAVVNPDLSSPTYSRPPTLKEKLSGYIVTMTPQQLPHTAALEPWTDVGDCWCTGGGRDGGKAQLVVLLGRPIVPEEVIVEHIPKGASLIPEAAPREMELWVEYISSETATGSGSAAAARQLQRTIPPPPPPSTAPATQIPPFPSLRETVLTTLHHVYPSDPESSYADDPLLGPTYFRVGKWTYDINGAHHIQRFELDAVIDVAGARVGKVVVRVKSNYGAGQTCLYRVRLHGHT
ncbi:hypothetical protein AJ80_09831 [Polytolypa hystricis UAMH7299]|uniref:SUN domain-containing protein n=1 Tax=Polytolypa hystricis (strain UAMH7299) TaxID=1447883 RepID=A0A2B7WI77_POLH7|nr:hypothetical protein AJ80_09831 [Polytolypa hystricis UAMH7299]